ncbi:hypothetical protein DDE82_006296 [Stemphylium lycopersici]|nr:hypothetical protein TW65_00260 [Stemphylium lycopersici]RAR01683.1 hypothetical protein DDE82_006296 [Stemphylium lycopersici]
MASTTNKHRIFGEPSSSPPAKKPHDVKRESSQKKPKQKAPNTSHRRLLPSSLSKSSDEVIVEEEPHDTLRFSSVSSPLSKSSQEETAEENNELLSRIQSGVKYVRERDRLGKPIEQTTRFELDPTEASSSTALDLLCSYGTLISSSVHFVVYELGIPRPDWVAEGTLPGLHDAQWWADKSVAEVKAGSFAEDCDVKRVEANIRGQQKKRSRKKRPTEREKQINEKLEEGLRRQKADLKMYDDDEGVEEESWVWEENQEKEGEEYYGGVNVGLEGKVKDEGDED